METTWPLPFGTQLKLYRHAASLTQAALAERAGYSPIYIRKLEHGERVPLPVTVAVLANALGLAPDEQARLEIAASFARTRRPLSALPPLVGRELELGLLEQHLDVSSSPLFLLAGEPGIGKSRLLREVTVLAEQRAWSVLAGRCHRRSGQEPYAPLVEALEGCFSQYAPEQQHQRLKEYPWLARLFPEMAGRLPEPLPAWNWSPEDARRLLFTTVKRFLHNAAGSAGTVLVLDDLHWAGADALDLLEYLVRSSPERPLRVIGAYRETELRPTDPLACLLGDLAQNSLMEHIRLRPLGPAEATRLLDRLLEGSEAGQQETLVERVVQRAGGVPYVLVSYAEELRAGALQGQSAMNMVSEVPRSVAESIRQRVATLPETARHLLGVVSIVEQETPGPLLLGLATQLGWSRQDVLEGVERACQARLLEETGEGAYRFPHDLIREVIEADLSRLRRVMLHQQVAESLEQQPGAPPVERLAYHYAHGEQPEKGIPYLERAGDRAAAMYAHAEAEETYRTLLELLTRLGHDRALAATQEKLAGILRVMGHYTEAVDLLEAARAAYQAANDSEALARVLSKLGQLHAARGAAETGIALVEPWLAGQEVRAVSPQAQGGLYLTLAYLFINSSHAQQALAAAEQAAACAEQARDDRLLGQTQWHIGRAFLLLNQLEKAVHRFEEALSLAERTGDTYTLYYISLNLDLIAQSRGELRASKRHSERALALAEQMGNPFLLAMALSSHASDVWSLGEWQQSRQENERAIALMRQMGMPWGATYPLLNNGVQLLAEGQETRGRAALEEAIRLARRGQDRQAECLAEHALAEQDLFQGCPHQALERLAPLVENLDPEDRGTESIFPCLAVAHQHLGQEAQARRLLDQALERATVQQMHPLLAETRHVQGVIATGQENWAEAKVLLEEALELYCLMAMPYGEAKVLGSLGELALRQGKHSEASERLKAALAICNRLGERLYATWMESLFAGLEEPTKGGQKKHAS